MNLNDKFDALARYNTDTYCGDLAHTAVAYARIGTDTAAVRCADLADRIIALRTAEQSAADAYEARLFASLDYNHMMLAKGR